jgi:diguanylate cyclase (GGDEF)-like protein
LLIARVVPMNPALTRKRIWTVAIRDYWWMSVFVGAYFVVGFLLWGSSRQALLSSVLFLVVAIAGLVVHYRVHWSGSRPQVMMIVGHLVLGEAILVWQKANLPLTDYTRSGSPEPRDIIIYLVSSLIVGAMCLFGGLWGGAVGLLMHYAFIFDVHEEFSVKWIFPIFMVVTGGIVSTAFRKLDQAYEQLEAMANHDSLTGLLNRHRLPVEFERLQKLAHSSGRPFLLVAWDLDDLKVINDQQGHAAGDNHICNFARALEANVRKSSDGRFADAAFRVGGDEFISMHLDARDGVKVMERVHESCLSVSAGWVSCETLTLDQALTQADKALYTNKQRRKDGLSITGN